MILKRYRIIFFILFTYLLTFIGGPIFFSQHINETMPQGLLIIQTFLLAGISEEMGWRGYLQPVLQKKFGSTIISIVIGIVVAVWHLPLFFQDNDIHSTSSFTDFFFC